MVTSNHLKQLLQYERKLVLCAKQSQRRIISPEYQGRTLVCSDTDQPRRDLSFWGRSKSGGGWKKALSDAEKIVGSPGSFMSLRCLLSDELSNIAIQMRKLVGTGHPLLEIARKFLFDGNHSMQMRGLLVLLISKAAGQAFNTINADQQMVSGIYPRQRTIAEITEMIHTAKMIHCGVVEMDRHGNSKIDDSQPLDESNDDMIFGNKIAVLSGDFLLANVSSSLAEVKNAKVVEIMSSAITDLTESEFSETVEVTGASYPVIYNDAMHDIVNCGPLGAWRKKAFLASGSLIAKSLQAALLLVNHTEEIQQRTFKFGELIGQSLQICDELQCFSENSQVNAFSLPVALQCERLGNLRPLHIAQYGSEEEQRKLSEDLKTSNSLSQARHLAAKYSLEALTSLEFLPNSSQAATALRNMSKHIVDI